MSKHTHPIGFFDSGVGGTSIWKEFHAMWPLESSIYLADSKNAPYGYHSKDEIIALSVKNTEWLLSQGCKMIVVACNTATTNAIDYLRKTYQVPFIGIEPAIKPALLQSKTKKVGVLATKGTLSSELFHRTFLTYGEGIELVERVGEGLVPLVEHGKINSEEALSLLQQFITPMLKEGVDHIVLGCTHYPYLTPLIKKIVKDEIVIVDSGMAVARQIGEVLKERGLLQDNEVVKSKHQFFTNGNNLAVLKQLLGQNDGFIVENLSF